MTLPLPRHWYKLPTPALVAMFAEITALPTPATWEENDVIADALDAIGEELEQREHDARDPSAGAAAGHFAS